MDNCCFAVVVFVVVCNIRDVGATCQFPGPLNHTVPMPETVKPSYVTGDMVMFACVNGDGRQGHIHRKCEANGSWTPPDRRCNVPLGIDNGSAVGMAVAACNLTVAMIFIACSRKERISLKLLKGNAAAGLDD